MNKAEIALSLQMRAVKLEFETEYRFHPTRRWRFDFAAPELMLAVEVEGITYFGKNKDGSMKLGRHQTSKGYEADLQKYDAAMKMGWTIYRCSPLMVNSGQAIETIEMLWRTLSKKGFK